MPQYRIGGHARVGPWVLWLLARIGYVTPFQEAVATRKLLLSNAKAKQVLGLAPRPLRETVRATAQSMIDGGYVTPLAAK